jgi:hypothetical protein
MKEIKDYIHLYINSEAKYRVRYVDSEDGKWSVWLKLTPKRLDQLEDASIEKVEYAIRRLEDITEEEKKQCELLNVCEKIGDEHATYQITWETPNTFHYLLKQGFDLFGLVDAGLAVDAKTIQPKTNNDGK